MSLLPGLRGSEVTLEAEINMATPRRPHKATQRIKTWLVTKNQNLACDSVLKCGHANSKAKGQKVSRQQWHSWNYQMICSRLKLHLVQRLKPSIGSDEPSALHATQTTLPCFILGRAMGRTSSSDVMQDLLHR